jgi:hypothetical protein
MNQKGWIGVDLDGTLAHYERWDGPGIGTPITRMVKRVKKHLEAGDRLKIFTARVSLPHGPQLLEQIELIEQWCELHLGQKLEITAVKDLHMIMVYDDRCVQMIPNTGKTLREHIVEEISDGI